MTYADDFNIRTTSVKFNDVADAIDGVITRQYATTTGTSSAYIANPTPAWQSYVTSAILVVTPHTSNAAGATIQLNGLAAKDMKIGGVAIPAGVLQTGVPTILAYTGTYFEVLLQSITVPVGQIAAYAGSTSPTGWLLCDATSYNTYTYRTLHAVISNTYGGTAYNPGTTDQPGAVTTFQVPDLRRRAPVGTGTSDTLGANDGLTYGVSTRPITHSHTISHTHTIPAHRHTVPGHVHGLASHTHTVNHSHPLSDNGAAKISLISTTLWVGRTSLTTSWTATNSDNSQSWGGSSSVRSDSVGLLGNTDSATPTSSGPSTSTTSGASADSTGFLTNAGEGAVTTDSQSTSGSGSSSHPHLFVNYIIKF